MKCPTSDIRNWAGFTLIETLVSIAIVGVIGYILVDLVTRSIQGNNKTRLLSVVKQNGQTALNILDTTIRNADNVVCPSSGSSVVMTVRDKQSKYIRIAFVPPSPSYQNGFIKQEELVAPANQSQIPSLCSLGSVSSVKILTDTDRTTGVSVDQGQFTISSPTTAKESVVIRFKVKPGVNLGANFTEQLGDSAGMSFQTTVQLR